jgi:UDP-N-acetylglucosamine acyltransferase
LIDPDARIDPDALIADGVTIGPGTIVGADVEIGAGTWIGPHVVIKGPTKIGKDNKIYQFSSVGDDPQDKKFHGESDSRLVIGDGNTVREFTTLNRGTENGGGLTSIGNDNWIMAYVHIAHDCHIANSTIMANNASLAGHVSIGDYAMLGGFTLVHQFCHIGPHAITRFSTGTTKDIPPYVTAAGNPAKPKGLNKEGLKRRGFDKETIEALRQAYKVIYRKGLVVADVIEKLEEMSEKHSEIKPMIAFINNSSRGIIR